AVPYPDASGIAIRAMESRPKNSVAIVMLLEGDQYVSQAWRKEFENHHSIFFPSQDLPTIILKVNFKITNGWMALGLAHETRHAINFLSGFLRVIADPVENRATDEYYAGLTEIGLLDAVNDFSYQNAIAEDVVRLEKYYRKNKSIKFELNSEDYRLDYVLGEVQSEKERLKRLAIFFVHAVFQVMDNVYGQGELSKQAKIDILHEAYKNGGLNF
ncbi:MAG: hypothetical protein NT091_03255, partial [Candidatus Falkowbacteria bacterium]|nr:hypothetical protein [Candidatus Falkowbacteria bacterium]